MTGKVLWKWGAVEDQAFRSIKTKILEGSSLYNPDYDRKFYVDVDSSDVGCGGCLYQVPPGADSMATENKQVIMWVSKAWDSAMINRPIYYKEGRGFVLVLKKCRIVIESSRFVTTVRTDHAPLRWIKYARTGPLAAWRIEELSEIDEEEEKRVNLAFSEVKDKDAYR